MPGHLITDFVVCMLCNTFTTREDEKFEIIRQSPTDRIVGCVHADCLRRLVSADYEAALERTGGRI